MNCGRKVQHCRLTVVLVLYLVLCTCSCHKQLFQVLLSETVSTGSDTYEEYEWHNDELLYQYAQSSSFTILPFNVPARTENIEFHVSLVDESTDSVKRTVVLSMRQFALPVLNVLNESIPDDFLMPMAEQETYTLTSDDVKTIMYYNPLPGRFYLAATILNPLSDIVSYLQWGEKLSQANHLASVRAVYTIRLPVNALLTTVNTTVIVGAREPQTYSFTVPAFTSKFSIIVSNCNITTNNSTTCPITIATSETPSHNSFTSKVDCGSQNSSHCILEVSSPLTEHNHYVLITLNDEAEVDNATLSMGFDLDVCESATVVAMGLINPNRTYVAVASEALMSSITYTSDANLYTHPYSVNTDNTSHYPSCLNLGPLGRINVPSDQLSYKTAFGSWNVKGAPVPEILLIAADRFMEVKTFVLQDSIDTGGNLKLEVELMTEKWTGVVWVCAMPHRVPVNSSVADSCEGGLVTLDSTQEDQTELSGQVLMPFPAIGTWYLAVQSHCSKNGTSAPCQLLPMVKLSVAMAQCPNDCGKFGECQFYMEGTAVFASCECYSGYTGLACNDDRHALTRGQQLTSVWLLTVSNLAFIPAIVLATHRRFYTLAAIFFFTCFFSAFYHACDANRVYRLCILNYQSLAFSDFLGSVMSFYAILATMCRITEKTQTFLLVIGALIIAMFQDNDRHNNLFHILPLIFIGLILIGSWLREMKTRKKLFPSKRRYLLFILPGLVLAILGISINYGEMSNAAAYQYSHSFWHVSLMLTPCLLLPPRRRKDLILPLSISAQDIISRRSSQGNNEPVQQRYQQHFDDPVDPEMFDAVSNTSTGRNQLI